jgi:choice-of-anchor C domain-containing protein
MRRGSTFFIAFGICLFAVPTYGALITNHSFEQPVVTHPDKFQYYYAGDGSISGWTIVGDSVDVQNTTRWNSHGGVQHVDLTGVSAGGIYQDLATAIDQVYRLNFWLAGNPEFANGVGGPAVKTMKLSWGSSFTQTLTFDVTGHTNQDVGWVEYSFDLMATGPTTRLRFESLTSGSGGPLLDDVSLIAIPEPGLCALAMCGVILLGRARQGRASRR